MHKHLSGFWRTWKTPGFWCILAAAVLLLGASLPSPSLAQAQDQNQEEETNATRPEPEPRRDNILGTFHEGIVMESGEGSDTVIMVTPPPESPAPENSTQYPVEVNVQPEIPVNATPPAPQEP